MDDTTLKTLRLTVKGGNVKEALPLSPNFTPKTRLYSSTAPSDALRMSFLIRRRVYTFSQYLDILVQAVTTEGDAFCQLQQANSDGCVSFLLHMDDRMESSWTQTREKHLRSRMVRMRLKSRSMLRMDPKEFTSFNYTDLLVILVRASIDKLESYLHVPISQRRESWQPPVPTRTSHSRLSSVGNTVHPPTRCISHKNRGPTKTFESEIPN
jgi:hypothetical protein